MAPGLQLSCDRASLCNDRWLMCEMDGECDLGFNGGAYEYEYSSGWVEMHADSLGDVAPKTGIVRTGPACHTYDNSACALCIAATKCNGYCPGKEQ